VTDLTEKSHSSCPKPTEDGAGLQSVFCTQACLFPTLHPMLLSWIFLLSTGPVCRAWMTSPCPIASWPSSGHQRQRDCRTKTPSSRTMTSSASAFECIVIDDRGDDPASPCFPPIPFRDEASFVLAGGELPSTSSGSPPQTMPIRQSLSSPHPLLSPPRRIPNPYGWMRDDSRTNATVLDHLRAENEYGERMISHLADLREELYREVSATSVFIWIFSCHSRQC